MPLAAEVWSAVRHDLAQFALGLDPPAALVRDDALLVLTGGPTADFNFAIIDTTPNAAPALREFVSRVQTAGVPALFMVPSAAGGELAQVARTFAAPSLLQAPGVEFWAATADGEPYSTLTCLRHHGPVGIWSMGTLPEHERKGAGRELLHGAVRQHLGDGFYLIATPPGKPLYDAVGFTTIDEIAIWTLRHSEQFAPH